MATVTTNEAATEIDERTKPPFLRRVRIRGYKSIAFCDVCLQPLTILVGRNAAGKSNFLDALAFLRDVMALGVPESVTPRGGWSKIACQTTGEDQIEMEIEASFICGHHSPQASHNGPSVEDQPYLVGQTICARYHLTLSTNASSVPQIAKEGLEITDTSNQPILRFETKDGVTQRANKTGPLWIPMTKQPFRPELSQLSAIGIQPFMDLSSGMQHMFFYNFIPEGMRRLQPPSPGQWLDQNGWNLASVIAGTRQSDEQAFERVSSYLSVVVPEITAVNVGRYGDYETVRFQMGSDDKTMHFDAFSMSDGTLRALGALMAAFQSVLPQRYPSVVGIEEPEVALHPAAMRALVDALDDATQRTQVLLTTHSADLLSARDVSPGQVLVVRNRGGNTQITPVDPASREIIQKELYTLAELQRMDKLDVDEADLERQIQLSRNGGS